MKQILFMNRQTLCELRVWDDFRVLAVIVNLGLNLFPNVKSIDMKKLQIETVEEKEVFELFIEQLKANKTLQKVSINRVFSKSETFSDRFFEALSTLKLTKITVHFE